MSEKMNEEWKMSDAVTAEKLFVVVANCSFAVGKVRTVINRVTNEYREQEKRRTWMDVCVETIDPVIVQFCELGPAQRMRMPPSIQM